MSIWKRVDIETATNNKDLDCTVTFIIFKPNPVLERDDILCLYAGEGHISEYKEGWAVYYKIAEKLAQIHF